MRDLEYLSKEKNLSTVCDVVVISSKALNETVVRVFRVFVSGDKFEKQETQAKISIRS